MTTIETRYLDDINTKEESRKVEGYAIVFNSDSNDLGFIEQIEPTALDNDTILRSDVFCWLNHDEKRGCLARSKNGKGSLKLTIDELGLRYEFEAPNTVLGDELLESIKRKDITSSSFAFTVAKGGDKWEKRDGKYYRTITKINRLYDVSPVYTAAYDATSVNCRSFNEMKKIEEEKLNEYWKNLDCEIDLL